MCREIQRHYDEAEIDIITNMLQKLWLEDFYSYTQELGGATAEIMKELLEFEADRRAIEITRNSFATDLNSDINRGTKVSSLVSPPPFLFHFHIHFHFFFLSSAEIYIAILVVCIPKLHFQGFSEILLLPIA